MAEKKTPFKKTAKPAAKTPVVILSDKEKVESEYKNAVCKKLKKGFVVMSSSGIEKYPLHSGIAKSESNAWKLAAHNL